MPTSPDLIVVNAKPKELHPIEDFLSSAADFEHRAGGSFSDPQNLAIHVTALVGASLSFVIVLIALRWFLLMRRSFRHQLVMFLIISDTAKALWYFVFSVVIFAKGLVSTPSEFCQASGFLLQFSIEACDMAIFIIALHSILYIKHPTSRMGEGGLYPYRKWICFLWLGPPLLSASLAFVNESTAYVTAGTFCFLPKRPFWYRLALSWVPRYLIISMILGMYIWIYVYIHFKFRGFENFAMTDSSDRSRWDSRLASPPLNESQNLSKQAEGNSSVPTLLSAPEISSLPDSGAQKEASTDQQSDSQTLRPWDKMTFATTRRLSGATASQPSLDESSGMTSRFSSAWSGETQLPAVPWSVMDATMHSSHDTGQKSSASPAGTSGDTDELQSASPEQVGQRITVGDGLTDQLKQTRAAIRKQLRYLFIYPLVHIIMWSFPFASHALTYSHYYVMHPIFWLAVVQTAMLSLQAGVDGILFSWMERPWRRVDGNSKLSIPFLKRQSKALLERHCPEKNSPSRPTPIAMQTAPVKRNLNWWEAEGRCRNDSVWMGTSTYPDTISPVISRQRTRSKSPEKQMPKSLQTRTRSSEKQTSFIPTLAPIPTETAPSTTGATPQPVRRSSLASTNTIAKSRGHQHSMSANTTASAPPIVPKAERDS